LLRITFLLTQSLESPGGGGRYFPLAKALVAQGCSVKMIALHHDFANLKQKAFIKDGVSVHYVSQMHVRKSGNSKTYFNPVMLVWIAFIATVRLFWALWHTPTDIIHVCKTQPMNGVAAWLVGKLRKTPVFLDSDDFEAVNNRFAYDWQQKIVQIFEDWMPSFADGISVGTSYIGDRFESLGYAKDKIVYLPNGVDRERFLVLDDKNLTHKLSELKHQHGLESAEHIIVYIGSISLVSHAIDLLLESFQLILHEEPKSVLLIVGAGEDLSRLQQMANDLGILDKTHFAGRVPLEDVPFYFRLGDVTVDPMRRSIQAESSLSLKLLESIAATVPCVTADIGDRKQMAGGAGIAVIPDDVTTLAEGVLTILRNPELASAMRASAHELREYNWWDKRVAPLLDKYGRIGMER
jgi:glycosyltransferase involved in cell wall biosynthesis